MSSFWLFFLPFLYFKYHPYNTTINFSQQSNLFSYLSICFENWKKWMLVHRGPVVVVRRLQLPHPFWESPPVRLGWIELGAAASLLPTFLASYYYSTVHTLQWRRHRRRNAAATVPSATPRAATVATAAAAAAAAVVAVSVDRPKMESSSRKPSCPSFSFNCTKTRRGKSILQLAACSFF